ncbi:hypothetical protein QYF36_016524 [Acer negundo]|nr:hypothetical protein QYF36_016524 [Acer negundo]
MGVKSTGAWGSVAWFMFVISFWKISAYRGDQSAVFSASDQHSRRKLDDIEAAISIDCGTPAGSSYTDDRTELKYTSDEGYINTGVNRNIASKFMSETLLQRSLESVRSFPEGKRNCYTMNPNEGKGTVYFIRASFMYGDFDDQDNLPEFDLYVGVNQWDTVKFDNASHVVVKEIIHTPLTNEIYVCLLNTGKGTPFISTLELRHFHSNIYTPKSASGASGALVLYGHRLDFGSTTNQIIRSGDDRYDRMWFPYQDQEDVTAIMEIKNSYSVDENWQGDPCAPICSWDGLNCSYSGYHPPKIISLNLSSRGLTGKISLALSNLKSLQSLDLSHNSLTGTIPEFLSQLSNLSILNLKENKLSGSIPAALKARYQNSTLDLRVDGNPDLCLLDPCKKKKGSIVVPVVAAVVTPLVILLALLAVWIYRRKKGANLDVKSQEEKEGDLKSDNRPFTFAEIVNMTDNFNKVLGKGGVGTVYHGNLFDGRQVAVKMISLSSAKGTKQFRTEAQLLMRVHHRNLVSFIGYCNDGTNLGIIYEYMAGGNLQQYLQDKSKEAMSWKERLQIAVDAAQGLEYLHCGCKPPIIHRDVKTANILLDENMQAKIADFGLSIYVLHENESHVSASVAGTVGYLDPEYYTSNRLTEKNLVTIEVGEHLGAASEMHLVSPSQL